MLAVISTTAALVSSAVALAGPAPCQAAQLEGHVGGMHGAAGTIAYALVFRNRSRTRCVVRGYPRLELKDARTRVRHGGIAFLERPERRIVLRPGRRATVLVAAGDVPVGSETTCPSSRTLLVEPRGSARAVHVHVHIRACGRGLLRESPFLRGVRSP